MTKQAGLVKITIEAAGYRWRAYGVYVGGRWQCHLVELLGSYPLDVAVSRGLCRMLREAAAQFLKLPTKHVQPITPDLILAEPV